MPNLPAMTNREKPTHGSVLLLAIGVLVCVAIYAAGYYNYMIMQKRLTERGTKQTTMIRVASAIATLAVHKLHFGPLLAENSGRPFPEKPEDSPCLFPLFQALEKPLAEMRPCNGIIDLVEVQTCDLFSILRELIAPFGKMGTFQYQVSYSCDPADFEECGMTTLGYRREKRGKIRLLVSIELNKQNVKIVREEFSFFCRVKVMAALVPVLSKFSLYLENADPGGAAGKDSYGLNRVWVDEEGHTLESSPARPLIFDHDGGEELQSAPPAVPVTYGELTKSRRGLVYLGGPGRLNLNLAKSNAQTPRGTAGETFQMYRDPVTGDGFYQFLASQTWDGEPITFYRQEVGVSPSLHVFNTSYYEPVRKYAPGIFTKLKENLRVEESSILRLNGSDVNRSPTLVLGNVLGNSLCVKSFEWPPMKLPPFNGRTKTMLYFYEEPAEFLNETERATGTLVPLVRANLIANLPGEIFKYDMLYASFVASRPYNLGYAFTGYPGRSGPWTEFPTGDPLYQLIRGEAAAEVYHQVPPPFSQIHPDVTDLRTMNPFLQTLRDPVRPSFIIDLGSAADPDFWTALERRGLFCNGVLTLNGWIRIRAPSQSLVWNRNAQILGNGGIILEEGDIVIQGSLAPISPGRSKCLIHLVALQGNIRVEAAPGAIIQASLIAAGRLVFRGGKDIRICGNLAAQRLFDSSDELDGFSGGQVAYFPDLAALPTFEGTPPPLPADSEQPLLSYNFELSPTITE
jgi:hypothetical protein